MQDIQQPVRQHQMILGFCETVVHSVADQGINISFDLHTVTPFPANFFY